MTDTPEAFELPADEPRQIVCTGEAGSDKWNAAFGSWEVDEFGMDSDETVGQGERLFVNRRLYDALSARVSELGAERDELADRLRLQVYATERWKSEAEWKAQCAAELEAKLAKAVSDDRTD